MADPNPSCRIERSIDGGLVRLAAFGHVGPSSGAARYTLIVESRGTGGASRNTQSGDVPADGREQPLSTLVVSRGSGTARLAISDVGGTLLCEREVAL